MASAVDNRKTVLITGCAPGGIGYALCQVFKSKGLRVFATARKPEDLASLENAGFETFALSVDDPESVKACYSEIERRVGSKGLDYLVNNACEVKLSELSDYTVPATEIDLKEARDIFETNFFSVIMMCQTFLPLLIKAKGTIVQIGSVAGIIPFVFGSVYNASKAALHSFSDTLRVEVAPFGVKVTTVITGGVQSRIARTKRTLSANSLYTPVSPEYQRRVQYSQEGAMAHDAYAKSVVNQILYPGWLNAYKKWIWEGNRSWIIKFTAGGWAWFGFYDWLFRRTFNLDKLKKA